MFPGARGRKSQNNSRTENTVAHPPNDSDEKSRARARAPPLLGVRASGRPEDDSIRETLPLPFLLRENPPSVPPLVRAFIN